MNDVKEPLIKSQNTLSRHSGACQNLVKTKTYWMLVFTSMTECILDQRFLKFISGVLLISSFALSGISYAQAASDGFGRLFTTPEERRNLQILRYSAPEIDEVIEIIVEVDEVAEEKTEPRDIDGITLNGIVYRQGGKSTAWLNGSNSYEGSLTSEYFRINTGDINSMKVSVTVPEAGLEFDLKVGQTYEPNYDRLLDIVENGDEITISRD